jgi:hypothetical protein
VSVIGPPTILERDALGNIVDGIIIQLSYSAAC